MTSDWELWPDVECRNCSVFNCIESRSNEDDEGHEDWEYCCKNCGFRWFIDGSDS